MTDRAEKVVCPYCGGDVEFIREYDVDDGGGYTLGDGQDWVWTQCEEVCHTGCGWGEGGCEYVAVDHPKEA